MSERFLTVEQVAERLAITKFTVRKWMREGTLPGLKDYHRGRPWRMHESELIRWMAERERLRERE